MSVKQVFNTSAELDYPTVLPTLDLDFANSKTLDPRITFERASGGTYVGADGLIKYAGVNEARFDHDPETGESLGLLIEESRTNIQTYSIPDSNWASSNSTLTENVEVSPDGSTTASLFSGISGNSSYILNNQPLVSGNTYTQSFFVKAGTTNYVQIAPSTGFGIRHQNFDLLNGVLADGDIPSSSSSIEAYPNGWYRISVTRLCVDTVDGRMVLAIINEPGAGRLPDSQGKSVYVWGAQLEEGTFPTSYIPTEGSTRTRSADNAIITQNNFNWYNETEGTFLLEHTNFPFNANAPVGFPAFGVAGTAVGDSLFTIQYFMTSKFGSGYFLVRNGVLPGGALNDQVGIDFGNAATGSKVSFAFKKNNFAAARNGILMGTDNLGVVPDKINVSMLIIGLNNVSTNSRINCHCKYLKYYPKRLPNSQLQALTE